MRELTADVLLPDGADAASAARAALRSLLYGWELTDPDWVYDAALVVSELVTNAVRHGNGRLHLHVHAGGPQVRLAVSDASTGLPRRRCSDPRSAGGRGLAIIDAVAAEWGADVHEGGKLVWVRLTPYPIAAGLA